MKKLRIGLIREGKVPIDRRVPLAPSSAQYIQENFPQVEVVCQSSDVRAYPDTEYAAAGIEVVQDVSACDVLLGVKEVPIKELIPEKCYFFFSHTIKKQEYNRDLLQAILNHKIKLVDYECLTDIHGRRLLAFGRYAGIVGAYNSIWAYGKRYNLYHIRRAYECFDLEDLSTEYEKVRLPIIKIVLTGGGRVAKGAMEVLNGMKIRHVNPGHFKDRLYPDAVYTQLNSRDYHESRKGAPFCRKDFFENPHHFDSTFISYAQNADILIAGAYWDPRAPALFTRDDIMREDFEIKVIADISCDIEGSIPSTKKPSTVEDPLYDYNPSDDKIETAISDEANITVMAVDNLPCELPRDASKDFGDDFISRVLPHLLGPDKEDVISRATITAGGALTPKYSYLQDFVDGN